MKIDRTHEDFFRSLFISIITCTLLVSITKSITHHYFVYITVYLLLIMIAFMIYDYHQCKTVALTQTRSEVEGVNSKRTRAFEINDKVFYPRKLAFIKKEHQRSLKEMGNKRKYAIKKQSYPSNEEDI